MFRIIKKMPAAKTVLAVIFLLVQAGTSLYLPYVTADIINNGTVAGDTAYIWRQGLVMILVSAVSLAGAGLNTVLSARIAYRLGETLRREVFHKALSFSRYEFDRIGTSSLITRNTNDVTQVQNVVELGLKFLILAPMYLFGGIFMTWMLSPAAAGIYLAALPFLVLIPYGIYRFASPLYGKIQQLTDRLNILFREGLTGVKVIRAFHKEEQDYQKYKQVNREFTEASITAGTLMSVLIPFVTLLISLASVAVTWMGAGAVARGSMEIGTIIGVISYATQILMGFSVLTNVILAIPRGQISAARIYQVLDMPLSIRSPENELQMAGREPSVVFDQVSFCYQGADRKTLQDISFQAKKGQTLAIIGSTGDGKTTLVNLLNRMYDADRGNILLNGTDIRQLSEAERCRLVSTSPQKSILFFGTIRSNMQIADPEASDQKIWKALEMAGASEFVRSLQLGLDSPVEKGGGNFSGGQKQRLCIARALLKEADIYIFDDSFSALDFKTDAFVQRAMKKQLKQVVTIIVAQRINTVKDADIIVVMNKGRLAGLGSHQELAEKNAVYQEIMDSQLYKEASA